MKRSILLLITGMLMMSLGVITQAQEDVRTILDIAGDTENLSTLVAAVEAADPAIAEALGGEGELTVLAPSNQAFENLLITLGMTEDDLFENPLLTDILRYHVIDGAFFADDLAELDADFAGTFLPDNFVAVSVADDGTITLNDVVTVVTADIDASNGVVHIIDDVLLPQAALEAFALAEAQNANVQVLHFSPDAPNVDVYVNGEVAISDLAFGANSGYVTLPAGAYEVAVAPSGTSLDDAVIGPTTLSFDAGEFVNIAAIGSVAADTLTVTVFDQSFPALEDNEIGLTVLHAIEGAATVDVVLNDAAVVEALGYPFTQGNNDGAFNATVTTPIDSLTVNVSGEDTVLLDLTGAGLETGTYYIVAVGGTVDAPAPYIYAISGARADELNDALFVATDEDMDMEATDETVMATGNIAEIVMASANADDAEFSILLQAIENADPSVLETLQGAGPLTVFAPTDQAFMNLVSSTGMSVDDLLVSEFLTDILLYHVVSGQVDAATVAELDGEVVPTLLGDTFIGVTVNDDGSVTLNEVANVVQTDIAATNGIVHMIDEVILPQHIVDALEL